MIAGRIRGFGWNETVGDEAIYQYVYTGARKLISCLWAIG